MSGQRLVLLFAAFYAAIPLADADPKAPLLPEPFHTKSYTHFPKVIGWGPEQKPTAPQGFLVGALARDMNSPRWIYVLPNGDILVAESKTEKPPGKEDKKEGMKKAKQLGESPNRIIILRDANHDGTPELRQEFITGLNQPFGMELIGNHLYVANTDAVLRFPYEKGATSITAEGEKILDLPAGGYNNHWTRNLLASPDGKKLYITVGSQTNVDEEGLDAKVPERAAILELDLQTYKSRIFATGLRNPNGMDWEPVTGALWTAVNERDGLGDNLVPDYVTSVKEGAFYGWPYSYFGQNVDPRKKGERPDLVAKAIVPDLALGSHTASLGLVFYTAQSFPETYHGGMFIGQRGSWNRSEFVGYRVAFVPFEDGQSAGPPADFLTGFIKNDNEVYGRPVGVAVAGDGSLLVADDSGNCIWRVSVRLDSAAQ